MAEAESTEKQPVAQPAFVPLLLNQRTAAAYLGVSRSVWFRLRADGRLPLPVRVHPKSDLMWRRRDLEVFAANYRPVKRPRRVKEAADKRYQTPEYLEKNRKRMGGIIADKRAFRRELELMELATFVKENQ